MNLGDFIDALQAMPQDAPLVVLDAVTLERKGGIGYPHSWRGAYRELAFDNDVQYEQTVEYALREAEGAVGATYQGWKGGDFTMSRESSIFSAEEGTCGNIILGVRHTSTRVEVIVTDFWAASY